MQTAHDDLLYPSEFLCRIHVRQFRTNWEPFTLIAMMEGAVSASVELFHIRFSPEKGERKTVGTIGCHCRMEGKQHDPIRRAGND